jgi:hypothetical protein
MLPSQLLDKIGLPDLSGTPEKKRHSTFAVLPGQKILQKISLHHLILIKMQILGGYFLQLLQIFRGCFLHVLQIFRGHAL